ncbi:hypothetical protein N7509_012672 [Penicillium cosmopolitanum]|uniref:Kelch repeat protein n=1 Tax=Penicillium cosmopolitanum TaxID=1131564 RepID=A0A9W9VEV8_9EURO|nr:uncharacterized protein N7509_012672 [Penicillium cosmopolitanum]KAJ5379553.1 hypothetical protein N7509_012672 [Penicillium cosmopolitanum]
MNHDTKKAGSTLYYIDLDSQFPVESTIPKSALHTDTINSDISVAHQMAEYPGSNGAMWRTNDSMYFFGGGFDTAIDTVSFYNVSSGVWKEVEVSGGKFNFGNRSTAQTASVPELGLGFIFGGSGPYMEGMIRFNSSDPNNLTWTNETLNQGSHGVNVPNLNAGTLLYIPASTDGMLISFGGGNVTEGMSPDSGWPYPADWNTVYVYDIASHTWWMQETSGSNLRLDLDSFCAVAAVSPDRSAFHISVYGGWSLTDQRAYEDVRILSIPSFQWINATELSNKTNTEQQVNKTIGRTSIGECQLFHGTQMIVLGGDVHAGAYSLTDGACSNAFEPVRVLDLSTYEWQKSLNTTASYEVPSIIYNKIGGGPTGGATVTVPAAGFADATLASLIQKRVPGFEIKTSSQSTTSQTTASQASAEKSHGNNPGAIAGGVVGGVAGLAVVIALVWYAMLRRKKRLQPEESQKSTYSEHAAGPSELSAEARAELASKSDMHAEMPGSNKPVAELA